MININGRKVLILSLVLLAGIIVRFYKIDTPSMWLDEMVVPLAAEKPVDYIFDRAKSKSIDSHPPYYHILIKGIMSLSPADFMLRLPSALAGVLSILLIFYLTRDFFRQTQALLPRLSSR